MYKEFETERVRIKPTSEGDSEFIYRLMNSPKFIQYLAHREINSVISEKDYIKTKMLPQLQRLGYSNYTIFQKTDNTKIGTCGLYDREGLEGIDIGFAFLPEYEGQGFAYEAANRLKKAAFEEVEIE